MKRPISLRDLQAAALSLLPMAFVVAGAVLDQRVRLGFSQWRTACRASGVNLRSLAVFTYELLPGALAGALLGGLVLQVVALASWGPVRGARHALAAHVGCTLAMLAGLLLCAFTPSIAGMLVVEALMAMGITLMFCRSRPSPRPAASVALRTREAFRA